MDQSRTLRLFLDWVSLDASQATPFMSLPFGPNRRFVCLATSSSVWGICQYVVVGRREIAARRQSPPLGGLITSPSPLTTWTDQSPKVHGFSG